MIPLVYLLGTMVFDRKTAIFSAVFLWIDPVTIYIFAFASLFLFHGREKQAAPLIRLSVFIILAFYIIWRGYQSRYILSAIPFLIILSVDMIFEIYRRISRTPLFLPRLLAYATFSIFLAYSIAKTQYINFLLSYPNNLCYF